MKHQLIVGLIICLSVSNVYGQTKYPTVHYSKHFTLEHAMNYDTSELNTPKCQSEQVIDSTLGALQEWKAVLEAPEDIQCDIDILKKVRELIVSSKASFEKVESDFDNQTSGFVQMQARTEVKLETQVVHKIFADEMNDILAQLETFNQSDATPSELSTLATAILNSIDALISELEDLKSKQPEFDEYIDTLVTKITLVKSIRNKCYGNGQPDTNPNSEYSDGIVSSATLDDFVYKEVGHSLSGNQGTEQQNAEQGNQFIANSGTLGFVQKATRISGVSQRHQQKRTHKLTKNIRKTHYKSI